jgi:8-oxo-dGTP pyrophosphatase MutT (NUDIX family)
MAINDERGFVTQALDTVHSWAMFRLLRRTVKSVSGEVFERSYVSTPGAVACVAITEAREIILVRQYRATFDDMVLEIPAGMRDIEGEAPEVTAVRELQEESGYVAAEVVYMASMLSSPGVTDSTVQIFFATGLKRGEAQPHGPEEDSMELVVVPFSEALAMIDDGRLQDSKSVFGILLAAQRYGHIVGANGVK